MHICHVNLAGGFSGGERQTVNLIRELAREGATQTLVARPGSRLHTELATVDGLAFRSCSHFLLGHKGGTWDLIHCHDGKSVYWAYIEYLLRKTPYIITRRVDNPLGKGRLTGSAYRLARRVVCLSRAIAASVEGRVPEANTVVIPSSFSGFKADGAETRSIRERYQGKRLVGQVGRLLEHKGYQVTIEAARLLRKKKPDLAFVFLGEGPDEKQLKQRARDLDNVFFVGHQTNVGSWLAAMDVFVFPSLHEGLGSTVLDAMHQGVPVIGAKAGGIPDMIEHEVTGLLVAPGDAEELAAGIERLLEDKTQAQDLAARAGQQLTRFSPNHVANLYLGLYRELLAGAAQDTL
ncbi:glycosyltransferase family 4 protein [Marinobacter sp. 1-3A]|uniref:glycosyltransferase family 4 protein n=1 Tax=Marinobacter sp. 1-3A TaxID=2582920 RepID=UPI001905F3F8|nr:glycosyltransferase family 4 protein [Marinobacter sp. 1-3A]MBK1874742.1 glycosyltransferase family 4 protein [Marinobacter sp. 1-3A]